jgi:uncharacterized protein YutE (UPF0331/DUF86 family)
MRLSEKLDEIEKFCHELEMIIPDGISEYKKDNKTKAACERYFEKIVEAIVDASFLVIKESKFVIPEDDKMAFDILARHKCISEDLATKLREAKGMRNIIAHEYGFVDDELVFHAITEELLKDSNEFVKSIRSKY